MAWSFRVRRGQVKIEGCAVKHKVCNNYYEFASLWYEKIRNENEFIKKN
jgi:hypothetical protein